MIGSCRSGLGGRHVFLAVGVVDMGDMYVSLPSKAVGEILD